MQILDHQTILVTGAAGFIGSHLVEHLLTKSNCKKVIAVDNLNFGSWQNCNFNDPRLQTLSKDIADPSVEEYCQLLEGVDYIFHLAAEKHNQSIDSPDRVIDVNITGTRRLFEAAGINKVKKVIFTSSLYAYGNMHAPAMQEDMLPDPKTVYGMSKLAGEKLLSYTFKKYELDFACARLFFTYGPKQFAGMGYKSVIVKNFERIIEGKEPTIFGDGKQSLDYIYVEDIVEGLIAMTDKKASQKVINLGSGKATSINELTKIMLEVSESQLEPKFEAPDWTAGTSRSSNTSLAEDLINWKPKYSLSEGLKKVYNWMKEYAAQV